MSAQITPNPIFKSFSNNGAPLVGGLLYSYAAGTSTPQPTYTDSSQSIQNTNPIVLDGRGECALWLDPTLTYKLNLTDSLGNTIPHYPVDNLPGGVFNASSLASILASYTAGPILYVYQRTAGEIAFPVIPSNYSYLPGDIRRYGAKIDGVTDDTVAFQTAIALAGTTGAHGQEGTIKGAAGTCMVSHIDFIYAGILYQGNGMVIRGNATNATSSVVDIRAGSSVFYDLRADCNFNPLYQCAIHWYTNDLNVYNPEFTRFVNLETIASLIGLCIGALPTQSLPVPNQGVVTTPPNATDAPLSESSIFNMNTIACVNGVYMSQPNGKIPILGGTVAGESVDWTGRYGGSGYSAASTAALIIKNANTQLSGLTLHGIDIVQNSTTAGLFLSVTSGQLYLIGCTVETQASSYLALYSYVEFTDCQDMGWNDLGTYVPFQVHYQAVGELTFRGGTVSFANGLYNQNVGPLVRSVASLGGALSPNYGFFTVRLDGVDLQDVPLVGGGASTRYLPVAQGLNTIFRDSSQSSWTVETQNFSTPLNDGIDVLSSAGAAVDNSAVDTSSYSITAYGANGNAASGGWTFAVTGADNWGLQSTSMTGNGPIPVKCFSISSAGGLVTATSARLNVTPGRTYLIKGWVKASIVGGVCKIIVNNLTYNNGGSSAIAASTTVLNVADTAIGNAWQQLQCQVTMPADTMEATLEFSVNTSAQLSIAGLTMT